MAPAALAGQPDFNICTGGQHDLQHLVLLRCKPLEVVEENIVLRKDIVLFAKLTGCVKRIFTAPHASLPGSLIGSTYEGKVPQLCGKIIILKLSGSLKQAFSRCPVCRKLPKLIRELL
ncbi:hypothetical protein SDC9_140520 [bioreactor metagenome]|uniref:Uncharacterized protein n=1 Tax=bioreactor metagenome TaxID=1076179 RepID=A0A645DXR0_9ZZZZ